MVVKMDGGKDGWWIRWMTLDDIGDKYGFGETKLKEMDSLPFERLWTNNML